MNTCKHCMMCKKDVATLVARLIVGGVFIFAGWMKVSDLAGTVQSFGSMGIPAFLAYFVSFAELIGGVMIVLGLWTCLASAVLAVIMVVAVWLTRGGGFQSFGMPLVTLAGLISLVGTCGGKYSLKCCCDCSDAMPSDAPKA